MRLSELQSKTIINILDGKSIGNIIDVNINEEGNIDSLVIEANKKILSFSKDEDIVVKWNNIKKIGNDVILIEQ